MSMPSLTPASCSWSCRNAQRCNQEQIWVDGKSKREKQKLCKVLKSMISCGISICNQPVSVSSLYHFRAAAATNNPVILCSHSTVASTKLTYLNIFNRSQSFPLSEHALHSIGLNASQQLEDSCHPKLGV